MCSVTAELAEQFEVARVMVHRAITLAGLQAEGPGARAQPAARRLPAALAGLEVVFWPGRRPPASRCSPGHSPYSGSPPPPPANPSPTTAELPMLIGWCMGVGLEQTIIQDGKTADQDQKRDVLCQRI
jgi:hypothetical protein